MFELKTLNTVMAMIVVILILSLIVQSIQSILKKWLKLKSTTLFNSLDDLFKYVESKDLAGIESNKLVQAVSEELRALGRVTVRGKPMMDSIAKDDLLKLLDKIGEGKTTDALGKLVLEQVDPAKVEALREKVSMWFETVMQSFEERYARHMKSVAIVISIVVVVGLNANFFEIYQNISSNDALSSSLIQKSDEIQKRLSALKNNTNGAVDATGAKTGSGDDAADLKKQIDALKELTDQSPVFGFTPLKLSDISDFIHAKGYWGTGDHPNERAAYLLKLLAGWAIMVMLLSVGAPFWQDALESLFGVKNLLRQKTDTKNVEDTGGQPKP
jgi:hypothetical protein